VNTQNVRQIHPYSTDLERLASVCTLLMQFRRSSGCDVVKRRFKLFTLFLGVGREKFVTLNEGFVTSQSFNHAFELAGFVPDIAMRVGDIFSLINLVCGGIGYSLLPGRIGAFSPRIRLIPLDKKYASHQCITLLLAKTRERDQNLLALAAECRMYGRRDKGC